MFDARRPPMGLTYDPKARSRALWTQEEKDILVAALDTDGHLSRDECHRLARLFQRTPNAIQQQANYLADVAAMAARPSGLGLSLTSGRDDRAPHYSKSPQTGGLTGTKKSVARHIRIRNTPPPRRPLQEGPDRPIAHEAMSTGRYVPFWERNEHALRETRDRLTYRDSPRDPKRLSEARAKFENGQIQAPQKTTNPTTADLIATAIKLTRRHGQDGP